MKESKKRVIFYFFVFCLLIGLFSGCFLPEEKATYLYTLAIKDTENRMIPYAEVTVKDERGKELYRAVGETNGTIQFRRTEKRVRIEVSSPYLTYGGTIEGNEDGKVNTIILKEEKEEKAGGITWRYTEGVLKPYLFLPKGTGVVTLIAETTGVEDTGEIAERRLIRLPTRGEGTEKEYLWYSLEASGELILVEISSIKESWKYGEDPIRYIEARELGGAVLFARGEAVGPIEERGYIANEELTKVGDISRQGGSVNVPDGIVNVWDLLYLLNNYGTNDEAADLGRIGSSVTVPPNGPFSHNLNANGPDGTVNVWDLLILLNAYGSTRDSINTPFAPINAEVESLGGNQYRVSWEIPYANDCQEGFYVYTLDTTAGFVPTTNHTALATVVEKAAREATIETSKNYVAICGWNNPEPTDIGKHFSKPTFVPIQTTTVRFADPILEAAVRNAAGYTGQPTGPIYIENVLGITALNVDGSNTQAERDGLKDRNSETRWERREDGTSLKNEERHRRFGEGDTPGDPSPRDLGGLVSLEGIQHLTNLVRLLFGNNQVSNLTPLQSLTNLRYLSFWGNQVSDLTPLQNLTNLRELYFGNNQMSDLTPLQNLTNLEQLYFWNNQVTDLTPLQNLTKLRDLDFYNNQVSDIAPLQNLTNLKYLWFFQNQVSSLTPLQNLTNLEMLSFDKNQVGDIAPLQNLTNLQRLDFWDNQVTDLTPLQNLTNLQRLRFSKNQVSDLTPLRNLTNLQLLHLFDCQVSDLTPLQNLTNLQDLWFDNNQVSDLTPLQNLTNLQALLLGRNRVSDITPVQNLTNLQELTFWRNQVSDISSLQNLTNLRILNFENNQVSDIAPLVNNDGIGSGDSIFMRRNFLDLTPGSQDMENINTLISRGCEVDYYPQN